MKIKKIKINSYWHLQNVLLDFTYPEGHAKAGQPLEKACIIGQSATGKTNILELIKNGLTKLENLEIVADKYIFSSYNLGFDGELELIHNDNVISARNESIIQNGNEYVNSDAGGGTVRTLFNRRLKLCYFAAEILTKEAATIFNRNPLEVLAAISDAKNFNINQHGEPESYIYEFTQEANEQFWFKLLFKILDHRKKFSQLAAELITKGTIGNPQKLSNSFEKWLNENENPLASFAAFFNPILERLNLEVDLANTEYSIPIKSKRNDEVIPFSGLSTGTKILLLSLFPLHQLNTTDAIILIDEPERSLFPDIQMGLTSIYKNLAPQAQVIVATHSPFIAAGFEPEERFILFFDENGQVAIRRGKSPIGDDPNDITQNDFNVDYNNEFGKAAYADYLSLKSQLLAEAEPKKKSELILKLAALGDKYNF